MEPDAVLVRADFKSAEDAAAFTEAFGELARYGKINHSVYPQKLWISW